MPAIPPSTDAAASPLRRLVYRSRSRIGGGPAASAAEIGAILATSRERNGQLDVTGALICRGARYAQLLEGPPGAVQALFDSIRADLRHDELETLEDATVAARAFPGWSMAYVGEEDAPDIPLTLAEAQRPVGKAQAQLLERLRDLLK